MKHGHARQLLLYGAIVDDLLAELVALGGMLNRLLDRVLHGARQGSGHAETARVQYVHGDLEALAHTDQYVLVWHAHVLEVDLGRVRALDAHLLLGRSVLHPAELPLHYERRHFVLRFARHLVFHWRL